MSSTDKPQARTVEEAREQIEETRDELQETVEALAAKADVKGRAKEKLHDVREDAAEKLHAARDGSPDAPPVVSRIRRDPARAGIVAAVAAGVVVVMILRGRR
jgi:DNA repair exonuclease SbcCD ATPase subunit